MAYVRVPTGQKIAQVTAKRQGFLHYECSFCKEKVLTEYEITQTASASYHVLQKQEKIDRIIDDVRAKAASLVEEEEQKTLRAINVSRDYSAVKQKIECPYCKKVQQWSGIPRPWHKSELFILWIFGLFFAAMFFTMLICENSVFFLIPCVAMIVLAILPLIRRKKRKAAIHTAEKAAYMPPHYYSKDTICELIEPSTV